MTTRDELANLLNGREYTREITKEECETAKASGLVVAFGASDDLAEFRGAIDDEAGACEGTTVLVHANGILPEHERCECQYCGYPEKYAKCANIRFCWCKTEERSWTIETDIPCSRFTIVEDGEPFSDGIVFNVSDLPKE
jgi:hypothetical protein